MKHAIAIFAIALSAFAIADVTWEFDDSTDLVTSRCITGIRVHNSLVMGQTEWDPYIRTFVPIEGIDVSSLPYLTVRLYSSGEADTLSAYYKCKDGLWGLGKTFPVIKGWATYRADLREAAWNEGGMAADARQWGGVSKLINAFRIDPGNQDGRWIVFDTVSLTAEPTGELGVSPEPTGKIAEATITCPLAAT